jgi:hypothetical protein
MTRLVILASLFFISAGVMAAPKPPPWPLQNYQIINSNTNGWSEQFFAYKDKEVVSIEAGSESVKIVPVSGLQIVPEKMKLFHMVDVNVLVFWTNKQKKLEMIILDKSNKLILKDLIKFNDTVSDLDLRFGQGRRPAFLFLKRSKEENKVSIWFDEREQIVFLQDTPVIAFNLFWTELSAYILTREGTKPIIKFWQKGIVSNIDFGFIPVFAEFAQIGGKLTLFAVDSKSTLWKFNINQKTITREKIIQNSELAFVKDMFFVRTNEGYELAMVSPFRRKLLTLHFQDSRFSKLSGNLETFLLIDENNVLPGSIRGNFFWIESNSTLSAYLLSKNIDFNPVSDLNWTVSFTQGFPELTFSWKSFPQNKKFNYRYIVDNNPLSPPLPEYRLENKSLKVNLSSDGNYYLHIQAQEEESKWDSPVYHIPVFWKYKPETPEIYLKNEVSPFVVSGQNITFVINNLKPMLYFAEVNSIPVYDPLKQVNSESGEVIISQILKPGRYYVHIRCKDPRTNEFSQTLHYLFFYESYVTEYTVGTTEYNRDIARLNSLVERYKNAQSSREKEEILIELDKLKKEMEADLSK